MSETTTQHDRNELMKLKKDELIQKANTLEISTGGLNKDQIADLILQKQEESASPSEPETTTTEPVEDDPTISSVPDPGQEDEPVATFGQQPPPAPPAPEPKGVINTTEGPVPIPGKQPKKIIAAQVNKNSVHLQAAFDAHRPGTQRYGARFNRDHECVIGGLRMIVKKGEVYQIPKDIVEVLADAPGLITYF